MITMPTTPAQREAIARYQAKMQPKQSRVACRLDADDPLTKLWDRLAAEHGQKGAVLHLLEHYERTTPP